MRCPNCQAEVPANGRFCGVCGQPLNVTESHIPAEPPTASATTPAARRGQQKRPRYGLRSFLLLLTGGVICLGSLAVTYFFVLSNLNLSIGGRPERIVLAIYEENLFGNPEVIASLRPDGTEYQELIYDRNGIGLPTDTKNILAPNGRWLMLYEQNQEGQSLLLVNTEDGRVALSDDEIVFSTGLHLSGFSPDGSFFAYTRINDQEGEIALVVVNEAGKELLLVPDAVYGTFFPDSQRLLVIQTDAEGLFASLSWLTIADGQLNSLASLADSSGWVRPQVAPDSLGVYYYADDQLMYTTLDGSTSKSIHEFESPVSALQTFPGTDYLALYDQYTNEAVGDLVFINPEPQQTIRIDRDVYWLVATIQETQVLLAEQGDKVAYRTVEDGALSLYVAATTGQNKHRISDDNAWIRFAFTPSGEEIIFIEGRESFMGGDFYAANTEGGDRMRLATDVWSFCLAERGRTIIYSVVEDIDRGSPESTVYRIRLNGEDEEEILPTTGGVITLFCNPGS